jgi:uncharacterized protein YqgQ
MYESVRQLINKNLHKHGILEYIDKDKHFINFMHNLQLKEIKDEDIIQCKENHFYYVVKGKLQLTTSKIVEVPDQPTKSKVKKDKQSETSEDS